MKFQIYILLFILLSFAVVPTSAQSLATVMVSRDSSTFTPPTDNCAGVFADGRQTPYTILTFEVTANTIYDLRFSAAGGIPTYTALYEEFDPNNPLSNCIDQDVRTGPGTNRIVATLETGKIYRVVIGSPFDVSDWSGTGTEYPVFFNTYFTDPVNSGILRLLFTTVTPPDVVTSSLTNSDNPQPIADGRITNFAEHLMVVYPARDENGDPALHIYCIDENSVGYLYTIITQQDYEETRSITFGAAARGIPHEDMSNRACYPHVASMDVLYSPANGGTVWIQAFAREGICPDCPRKLYNLEVDAIPVTEIISTRVIDTGN